VACRPALRAAPRSAPHTRAAAKGFFKYSTLYLALNSLL